MTPPSPARRQRPRRIWADERHRGCFVTASRKEPVMSLPRSVPWVAAALMASAACSHNEELKQTPKVVAAAPRTAPPPAAKPQAPVAEEAPQAKADDAIYFDFDSAVLRNEAHPVLQRVADSVQRRPKSLRIEGNCD